MGLLIEQLREARRQTVVSATAVPVSSASASSQDYLSSKTEGRSEGSHGVVAALSPADTQSPTSLSSENDPKKPATVHETVSAFNDKPFKVVAVGDEGSGKTALLRVLGDAGFEEIYTPTISESFYSAKLIVSGEDHPSDFILCDTAGSEELDRLRPFAYEGVDIWLICFSLVNRQSLIDVTEKWVPEVQYYHPKIPLILVGCQLDRREELEQVDTETPVKTEEVLAVAHKVRAHKYIECSAKTGHNCKDLFKEETNPPLEEAAVESDAGVEPEEQAEPEIDEEEPTSKTNSTGLLSQDRIVVAPTKRLVAMSRDNSESTTFKRSSVLLTQVEKSNRSSVIIVNMNQQGQQGSAPGSTSSLNPNNVRSQSPLSSSTSPQPAVAVEAAPDSSALQIPLPPSAAPRSCIPPSSSYSPGAVTSTGYTMASSLGPGTARSSRWRRTSESSLESSVSSMSVASSAAASNRIDSEAVSPTVPPPQVALFDAERKSLRSVGSQSLRAPPQAQNPQQEEILETKVDSKPSENLTPSYRETDPPAAQLKDAEIPSSVTEGADVLPENTKPDVSKPLDSAPLPEPAPVVPTEQHHQLPDKSSARSKPRPPVREQENGGGGCQCTIL